MSLSFRVTLTTIHFAVNMRACFFNCSYRFIQVSSISYEIVKLYSHLKKKIILFSESSRQERVELAKRKDE